MILLFSMLGLGIAAGHLLRTRDAWIHGMRWLTRVSLWLLLFCMGAKLALGRDRLAQDLGALVAALGSTVLLGGVFFGAFAAWGAFQRRRGRKVAVAEPSQASESSGAGHELIAVGVNGGCILAGFLVFLALPSGLAARLPVDPATDWILRGLLFCVGFDLGVETSHLNIRAMPRLLLLAPLANLLLTLVSAGLFALLTKFTLKQSMLVHSGLGWYSLSSVLLSERGLVVLSLLAFIHNVFRELFSILTAPFAARVSPYLPIFLGGATSMDVMLPFVQKSCGRGFTLVSFYSGMALSFSVIPLVKLLLAF